MHAFAYPGSIFRHWASHWTLGPGPHSRIRVRVRVRVRVALLDLRARATVTYLSKGRLGAVKPNFSQFGGGEVRVRG